MTQSRPLFFFARAVLRTRCQRRLGLGKDGIGYGADAGRLPNFDPKVEQLTLNQRVAGSSPAAPTSVSNALAVTLTD